RALPAPGPAELPFDAAAIDVAYGLRALHALGAADAVRLLAELGRVVRSGGSVVLAVRGWAAMATDVAAGAVSGGRTTSLLRGMYRTGHHVLGEGDAPRAYMTLEWLMAAVQELFALERHLPARLPSGEDVVVLARR
ncbi:MAG TPA: methyltransferase domain-containing protein, partial [Solirubrobacteraceae bacterium]|nr:methyltransferase domain-containing protein [Solirubrobacteraceae bacterium]